MVSKKVKKSTKSNSGGKKTTTPVVKTASVKTPVVKTASVKTPVVKKKVVKSKVKSTKTDVKVDVKADVTAAVKEAAVGKVDEKVEEEKDVGPTLQQSFTELLSQLGSLRSQLTSVTAQTRALAKRSEREIRAATKAGRKRPRKNGVVRAPSGFVKPALISQELATFLGKEIGTEMARTAVTREINKYIVANKLRDPKNGRRILPDIKLQTLLKIKKDEELTYFNLQRYMSQHFAKSGKNTVVPVVSQ